MAREETGRGVDEELVVQDARRIRLPMRIQRDEYVRHVCPEVASRLGKKVIVLAVPLGIALGDDVVVGAPGFTLVGHEPWILMHGDTRALPLEAAVDAHLLREDSSSRGTT